MRKWLTKETFQNLLKCVKVSTTIPSDHRLERGGSYEDKNQLFMRMRTLMTQERFSNLTLLHIENGILKERDKTHSVVETFSLKPKNCTLNRLVGYNDTLLWTLLSVHAVNKTSFNIFNFFINNWLCYLGLTYIYWRIYIYTLSYQ